MKKKTKKKEKIVARLTINGLPQFTSKDDLRWVAKWLKHIATELPKIDVSQYGKVARWTLFD